MKGIKDKLPVMAAASEVMPGKGGNSPGLPGARIHSEDQLPVTPTQTGATLEHLALMHKYISTITASTLKIFQYETEAIANRINVANMPKATILQEAYGLLFQGYANKRRAADRTCKTAAGISRGYAKKLGHDVRQVSDNEIHGHNAAMIQGDLGQKVAEAMGNFLGYASAIAQTRIDEAKVYAEGSRKVLKEVHPFNVGDKDEC